MKKIYWMFGVFMLCLGATASAQVGDATAGRQTYTLNCARCHGVSPDGNARSAANSATKVASAINSVSGMQFMIGVFTQSELNDLAAFLGNPNIAPTTDYILTISKSGTGAAAGVVSSTPVGLICGALCAGSFASGTLVTLTAVTSIDTAFKGWSGGCTGSAPVCVVAMTNAKTVIASFDVVSTLTPRNYSDMWWAGESENGWGLAITQHQPSNQQFNAFYVYNADGLPTWYVMPGGTWNSNFTVFSGALYHPTGTRLDNFVAENTVVGAAVGNATLTFTNPSTATLTYTINGISASKKIERQVFGPPDSAAGLEVGDLWWGGEMQSGWGMTVVQQNRTLFGVWYTYGTTCTTANSGCAAIWYVMPGGAWGTTSATANTYTGTLYSTVGAPWLGTEFNKNAVKVAPVGTVSIIFSPDTAGAATGKSSNAVLTYTFTAGPFSGTTQTKQITRQRF